LDAASSFDSKASTMLSIGSTILPITAGLLANNHQVIKDHLASGIALIVAAVAYFALVAAFQKAYRLSKWDDRPYMAQWKSVTPGRTAEEVHRWLGDACVDAYQNNEPTFKLKGKSVGIVLWSLSAEAIALAVAVTWPLIAHFAIGHDQLWL
jgi:hypothetical protein